MSMYNMLFQVCPLAPYLLKSLGLDHQKMGRMRDVYFNEECDRILVLTRNGGNNRESHQQEMAYMQSNPFFDKDYDEKIDNTYATLEFKIPEGLLAAAAEAKKVEMGYKPFPVRFNEMLDKMKSNKNDPDVRRIMHNMKPLEESLLKFLEGNSPPGHTNVITI